MNSEKQKPILGYDKFLMMALLKEGTLSLKQLREKSMLFLSLIWYQQLPGQGQMLRDRMFFRLTELRSRLEDGRAGKAAGAVEDEMEKLIEAGLVEQNADGAYQLTGDGQTTTRKYHEAQFEKLVDPLQEQELLIVEGEGYRLTELGGKHLQDFMNNFKYYDVHRSDTILLAMAEDKTEDLQGAQSV